MSLKPHLKVPHNSDFLPSQPASFKHTNINCLVNCSRFFSRVKRKKKKPSFLLANTGSISWRLITILTCKIGKVERN